MKRTEYLSYHIEKYFGDYLPNIQGASDKTIKSYSTAMIQLLTFINEQYKVNINKLSVHSITREMVENYLNYVELDRQCCISTRNQRLAAIHSFFEYLQKRELSSFNICSDILSIPQKKSEIKMMSFFSKEEVEILMNHIDISTIYGFRDYTILLYLYETASRAEELVNLKYGQIRLSEHSYVLINGKGKKERRVPLSSNLSSIFNRYFKTFDVCQNDDIVFMNRAGNHMTTKGLEYIFKKYVIECRKIYPDKFKDHYSLHSMRHSRAMHLLESGINLIYIRDLLGHSSVMTTEIYAKTNTKIKEKHIREHSAVINSNKKYTDEEKEDLMKYLKKLQKNYQK